MALDTQVNLAEIGKGSFYIQREWLEEWRNRKACFTVNTVMIKTTHQTQCPLHIAVVSCFSWFSFPFSPIFYEKRLLQSIYDTNK